VSVGAGIESHPIRQIFVENRSVSLFHFIIFILLLDR